MSRIMCLLSGILITGMLFISCREDESAVAEKQIPQEVLDKIWNLGFSNENVQKIEEGYLVEGDIILTEENLNEHKDHALLRIAETEQYHTYNLVNAPQTITVSIGTTLTDVPGYSAALDVALARYNAENLELNFVRVGSEGGEIHLKKQAGNFLASAGFPSNSGAPYSLIKMNSNMIGSGNNNTFINFCATIMAHEIGHCIGMRHTDYMNRAYSCNSGGNEGAGSIGAVHIPGTPSGPDANSWMLACISYNENRPFNNNDKAALGYLY